uniref:G_PROTEIN_RECEP_F1_2 domain-containing protein n=1 Tax=Heterorhabditis bacteriophora TaxID=37862 RepID=A0A1I7XNC4_HETBA
MKGIIILISVTATICAGTSSITRIVNYLSDSISLRDIFSDYGENFFIIVYDFGILIMITELYSDCTSFGITVLIIKLLICCLATAFIISRSRELRKQRKNLDKALKDKYIITGNLQINKVIISIALVNIVQRLCLIIFQFVLYLVKNYAEALNNAEKVIYSVFMLYITMVILHSYNRLAFSKSIHNSVADEGLSKSERISKTTDMYFIHLNRIWNSVP